VRLVLEAVGMEYDAGLPGASVALRGVNLSIGEGECVAIIGPTGSGKTTLLEIAAGLAKPTAGSVRIDPAVRGTVPRSAVGLVYQFPECQFFEDTVFEDVAFGPRRQGIPAADVERRVVTALERASLPPGEFASRHPLTLSAGEKRRAAVACILALDRPFLLLDEPTAGLDPGGRNRMLDLVVQERAQGRAVVVVTHDLDLADAVAERVVVLGAGRVLADGDARSVLGDAAALRRVGLEAPPAHALVALLRARNAPDAERVADAVLGRRALAGGRGR
jgi:energy-coupling factor transport system ATP-binding protein